MSYLDTIENFRQLVSAGVNNVANIQALFVPDDPTLGGPPNVGLTTGGPQFTAQGGIYSLFTGLYQSFPHLVLRYPTGRRPEDGNTVAVEALLTTGVQNQQWAPPGAAASPPISHIVPSGAKGGSVDLPLCAVFLFYPGTGLIQNLALYFDRWQMAKDLWDGSHPGHLEPR
jgi:hypothetical protein